MFVIVRDKDSKYVAADNVRVSFTQNLRKAKIFETQADAEAEAEPDQTTVTVRSQLMTGPEVPLGIGLKPIPPIMMAY